MATKKRRNPNAKNVDKSVRKIDKLADKYRGILKESIEAGNDPRTAARIAFERTGWIDETTGIIGDGIAASVKTVSAGISFSKKTYLNKVFDGVKLSDRIVSMGELSSAAVGDTIRQNLADGAAWNRMAKSIERTDLIGSDPTKRLGKLTEAARRAWAGNDPAAVDAYRREVARFEAHVARLLENDSPLGGLKRAYAKVLKATETGSESALQKAIDNAVQKKMAYNAQRIARTEMQRAWGIQTLKEYKADPDIGGVLWVTSSDERLCDVCESIANDDIGYGKGFYPFDKIPDYPVHPNCRCNLQPATKDEFEK
jgi:SPP1 gp7 family putative phage head morphogenesis protein